MNFFRRLRARGIKTFLICHERTRDELTEVFKDALEYIHFIPDSRWHAVVAWINDCVPKSLMIGHLSSWHVHRKASCIVRELVKTHGVNVVHQPSPVSPRFPSAVWGCDAPVVIGPLNGNMKFPPGFGQVQSGFASVAVRVARVIGAALNRLIPGKARATTLLVANARTKEALPVQHPHVLELFDNGVDLDTFEATDRSDRTGPPTFVFLGRFEAWKGPHLLLQAWKIATQQGMNARLRMIGDGDERTSLEQSVKDLGIQHAVEFTGFLNHHQIAKHLADADGFIYPSYWEAGGAVVLEAMASALPVIILDWGGPTDYLDSSCGILIPPKSKEFVVDELARQMLELSRDNAKRVALGLAARQRAERFDWKVKIERTLEIYRDAIRTYSRQRAIN